MGGGHTVIYQRTDVLRGIRGFVRCIPRSRTIDVRPAYNSKRFLAIDFVSVYVPNPISQRTPRIGICEFFLYIGGILLKCTIDNKTLSSEILILCNEPSVCRTYVDIQ